MMSRLPVVAIVGRPNVGKSTLFNRIVGGRSAIVDDQPGVTRDRKYAETEWAGREFTLMDTGGYLPAADDQIARAIFRQVNDAIIEADMLVFLVDLPEVPGSTVPSYRWTITSLTCLRIWRLGNR